MATDPEDSRPIHTYLRLYTHQRENSNGFRPTHVFDVKQGKQAILYHLPGKWKYDIQNGGREPTMHVSGLVEMIQPKDSKCYRHMFSGTGT